MGKRQISSERKTIYYAGMGVMVLGFLLFISNFFVDPFVSGQQGMATRGIGGMVLVILGGVMTNVGARGAAGSGLILDPEKAREDLEPWARTAGGLVKDALDEVGPLGDRLAAAPVEPVVKVRCPNCRVLNDEDARFCKGCGAEL